ncbi:unnamed protein product [Phytomonas sp. EM1]|nr:unnamed protein product [Phytomonas sp. EM1]|eukprot:CCW65170.1 unnamed protein product [Phytomonas sp. isolate EM1]
MTKKCNSTICGCVISEKIQGWAKTPCDFRLKNTMISNSSFSSKQYCFVFHILHVHSATLLSRML